MTLEQAKKVFGIGLSIIQYWATVSIHIDSFGDAYAIVTDYSGEFTTRAMGVYRLYPEHLQGKEDNFIKYCMDNNISIARADTVLADWMIQYILLGGIYYGI